MGRLEPDTACYHCRRQIGASHPGCEGAKRAVSAGVAVGPNYDISGQNKPLLGQKRVFDPHATHFEIVGEVKLFCEIAHHPSLDGRSDILVGDEMVGHQTDALAVEHLLGPSAPEGFNSQRGCYIVSNGEIDPYFHKLFRENLRLSGVIGQNFFTDSLGH